MLELNREAQVVLKRIQVLQISIMRRTVIVAPVVATVLKESEVQTLLREIVALKHLQAHHPQKVEKVKPII